MVSKLLEEIQEGLHEHLEINKPLAQIVISRQDLRRRLTGKLISKMTYIHFALEFDFTTSENPIVDIAKFCKDWSFSVNDKFYNIYPYEVNVAIAKLEKLNLVSSKENFIQLNLLPGF